MTEVTVLGTIEVLVVGVTVVASLVDTIEVVVVTVVRITGRYYAK